MKEYKSDNGYGLPSQVMRPVHIYSVSTTEASFNLANYKEAQHTISPFMRRWPRSLPFPWRGLLTLNMFNETPNCHVPEVDSHDEEYLPTADLDDLVWSEEPVPDSQEYLCIQQNTQASNSTPATQSSGDASNPSHNLIK